MVEISPLPEKLTRYVESAEELLSLASTIAHEAERQLRTTGQQLDLRDRVLTGLAVKIYGAFRALVDDARLGRAEAMHHLKTMTEVFIYFHVVLKDPADHQARRLLAEACRAKLTFLRENEHPADEQRVWQEMLDELNAGLPETEPKRLPKLVALAKRTEHQALGQWYTRVYRLACEPAHIDDLFELMPPPTGTIALTGPTANLHAQIAVRYGIYIALNVVRVVCEQTGLGSHIDFSDLETRLAALEEVGADTPRP